MIPRRVRPLLLAAALLLGACRVETTVHVDVQADGSGTVALEVALDRAAMLRVPDLDQSLRVEDLTEAGWVVTGPTEVDGTTTVRAEHRFGTTDELTALVAQIAGTDGPFRDFRLTREDAFAESRYTFTGTADLQGGLAAFSDTDVAAALDGEPLGQGLAALEEQLDDTIDQSFPFTVAVRLPGDVDSNSSTPVSNGAVWHLLLTDPDASQLSAVGVVQRTSRLVWAGVAAACGVALLVVAAVRVVAWRRRVRT